MKMLSLRKIDPARRVHTQLWTPPERRFLLGGHRNGVYGAAGRPGATYSPVFYSLGTNWYTRGADLTGASTNFTGTVAFILALPSSGLADPDVLIDQANDNRGLNVQYKATPDRIRVRGRQGTTTRLEVTVPVSLDGVARHYFCTFDLENSSNRAFLINGVDAGPTWTSYSSSGQPSWTGPGDWSIGALPNGGNTIPCDLADLFWNNSYLGAGAISSFYDGGFVDPSTNWPAGLVKFYGGGATNQGSGGGFTLNTP